MKIIKLDTQGRGITYYNNKIVFVNNALVGEDVEIKITTDKKKYSVASVSKYNELSDRRICAECEYYGICGGCQLQHISYPDQLEYKKEKLNNIFKKLNLSCKEIIYDQEFYYRNKLTLQINKGIGLYKINSNDIVSIDKCLICNKLINDKIKFLTNLEVDKINKITLKTFGNKVIVELDGDNTINLDEIKNKFDTIYLNDRLIKGDKLIASIGNLKYYISPNAFFQVNPYITEKMYTYVKELCVLNKAKNVIDLYCGCGSISLFIADSVNKVLGIEINENSIKDAKENKSLNSIDNATFKCDDTNNISIYNGYDTVIVDPPRSGLSKVVTKKLLNANIKTLIYISCDPMTLQRDLIILNKKYEIKSLKGFDMFPNTYHVESVVLMKKRN